MPIGKELDMDKRNQAETLKAAVEAICTRFPYCIEHKPNEANTKSWLIEPLLTALDWDMSSPEDVHKDVRIGAENDHIDYVLLRAGHFVLGICVTPFATEAADALRQEQRLLDCATRSGIGWLIQTDGRDYRIYNAAAPVRTEKKCFSVFSLSDVTGNASLLDKLSGLSKDDALAQNLESMWKEHLYEMAISNVFKELASSPAPLVDFLFATYPGHLQGVDKQSLLNAIRVIPSPMN